MRHDKRMELRFFWIRHEMTSPTTSMTDGRPESTGQQRGISEEGPAQPPPHAFPGVPVRNAIRLRLTGRTLYGSFPYRGSIMTTPTARLDLRLDASDKARIARAANLRGVPLSAFVRDAVLRETENVMAAELTVSLSPEESRRFLSALDKPFKPNARLRKAMEDAARLMR
jgi:uncharacterized protein (DUF1778 family)